MWSRKVCALLLAVALVIVLALPVSADSLYDPWIDIAEVCTVNDSGSNYFAFNGSTTVTLSPGFSTIVSQIDMVWFCGYGAPSAVYLWRNENASSRLKLTVQHIGGSYYRIYGGVANYTLSQYKFDIETGTTAYRSYEIKSCRIAESIATYSLDVSYAFEPYYDAPVSEYVNNVIVNPAVDIKYGTTQNYSLELYSDQWKSYDYLDLHVTTTAASIGSIVVSHNGRALPYDVSYLFTDSGLLTNSNDIYTSPLQPNCSAIIHIDISSVSRTSNIPPEIQIEGWWNSGVGCGLQFDLIGYIAPSDRTGVAYWFEKAKDYLTGVLDPDVEGSEDYMDEAASQRDQLDSMNQSMNQVVKPDVGNLQMDIQAVVDPSATNYLTSSLSGLSGNSLIVQMMCIALTIALVGYVLYGKK